MRRIVRNNRNNSSKGRTLRAAVAGVGALIAVPILSACDREPNYAAISTDEVSKSSASKLARSEDPKERKKGMGIIVARSKRDSKDEYAGLDYKLKLRRLATDSEYADVRTVAVEGTNDPNRLQDIVIFSQYEDSGMAALEKLSNMVKTGEANISRLANAVADARNDNVRAAGLDKIANNEDALFQAYNYVNHRDGRKVFLEKLAAMAKNLKNEDAKIIVALYSENSVGRFHALKGLHEKIDRIGDVAQSSRFEDTRTVALRMLREKIETAKSSIAKGEDVEGNKAKLVDVRRALENVIEHSNFSGSVEGAEKLMKEIQSG